VLGYHAISEGWPVNLAVPERELSAQLEILQRRGYVGFTFAEAERRRLAGTLPPRSVTITFDDGYASVLAARESLARVGFPGTVFVVTRFVETGEPLEFPGIDQWRSTHPEELASLTWQELELLRAEGWEIGSHTVSHALLPAVDDELLEYELVESRRTIESVLGTCETLAYPYGVADERVASAADRAGYLAACTLVHSHRRDEPLRRPRVAIARGDAGFRLAVKLSPRYLVVRRSRLGDAVDRIRHARRPPPFTR
jgi:peptidoglycan/xylan/chitin deacetylase (PgdA/CDA1 family)